MPAKSWSPKRERQYKHIKESVQQQGKSEKVAEEIAARTVNKERAQHGEAKEASKSSINDMPSAKRGGQHSHSGSEGRTYAQLYNEARSKGITGRSTMNKAQLEKGLSGK